MSHVELHFALFNLGFLPREARKLIKYERLINKLDTQVTYEDVPSYDDDMRELLNAVKEILKDRNARVSPSYPPDHILAYYQSDPRGISLYLFRRSDKDHVDINYSSALPIRA